MHHITIKWDVRVLWERDGLMQVATITRRGSTEEDGNDQCSVDRYGVRVIPRG